MCLIVESSLSLELPEPEASLDPKKSEKCLDSISSGFDFLDE
jgi:hypothetical protein